MVPDLVFYSYDDSYYDEDILYNFTFLPYMCELEPTIILISY